MSTKIEIYNGALGKIGVERMTGLTDESKQRYSLDDQYEAALYATFKSYGWRFATKRAQLALDSTDPVFGFENRFALPSDYIRTLEVWNGYGNDIVWEEEAGFILTDEDTFYIKYTFKETNEGKYTPLFVEALQYQLASLVAIPLKNNRSLAVDMQNAFINALTKAQVQDAKGRSKRKTKQESSWLSSRTTPVNSFVNYIKVT